MKPPSDGLLRPPLQRRVRQACTIINDGSSAARVAICFVTLRTSVPPLEDIGVPLQIALCCASMITLLRLCTQHLGGPRLCFVFQCVSSKCLCMYLCVCAKCRALCGYANDECTFVRNKQGSTTCTRAVKSYFVFNAKNSKLRSQTKLMVNTNVRTMMVLSPTSQSGRFMKRRANNDHIQI